MRHMKKRLALVACVAAIASTPTQAREAGYEITITNVTRNQVFSPVAVVAHTRRIALFKAGQPASAELAAIAEAGDAGPLVESLEGNRNVLGAAVSSGPVMPGATATIRVASRAARRISVASMLVNTNDAFLALNSTHAPRYGSVTRDARAYDAGTEPNDEVCANIPGPACDGAGPSLDAAEGDEGYVHIHPGIHGIGDLDASEYDWRNPVAVINIRRVWLDD